MKKSIKIKVNGAGIIKISNEANWSCGGERGFAIGVSWGKYGFAAGVITLKEAEKLANHIKKKIKVEFNPVKECWLNRTYKAKVCDSKNQEIKVGDIIMFKISFHIGITRVILHGGELCMEENFMYGDKVNINQFMKESYHKIAKMSLVDVYKFCKENEWDTGEYIRKFGKKWKYQKNY